MSFGNDMQAQLERYQNAMSADAENKPRKRTGKAAITYEIEPSGIDMVVSKLSNGKCTMKMYVYLSKATDTSRGVVFIESLASKSIRDATAESMNSFLVGVEHDLKTGCDSIPVLRKGKQFSEVLEQARSPEYVTLFREGLLNTEVLYNANTSYYYSVPWYVPDGRCSSVGVHSEDRHVKLMRHMLSSLADKYEVSYGESLAAACQDSYRDTNEHKCVWAFCVLADLFDEPFAKKCFDEYIDNEELSGLTAGSIRSFTETIMSTRDAYGYYRGEWVDSIKDFKAGRTYVTFEKNRFWDYLQESVSMGLGKNLSSFLNMWSDYIRQAKYCDGKVREKYPDYLQTIHDVYSAKYTRIKDFNDKERLRVMAVEGSMLIDQEVDGYQLKTLHEVNEFLEEARQNCNCVASYVDKAKSGKCWIASLRPIGSDTTQLTVEVDPKGELVQVKGKFNREPTKDEWALIHKCQETINKRLKKKALGALN